MLLGWFIQLGHKIWGRHCLNDEERDGRRTRTSSWTKQRNYKGLTLRKSGRRVPRNGQFGIGGIN